LDHHPERGLSIAGTVLAFEKPIGSSSSSSVLLELIHNGAAPAAILLGDLDAILIVGCLVAKGLDYPRHQFCISRKPISQNSPGSGPVSITAQSL